MFIKPADVERFTRFASRLDGVTETTCVRDPIQSVRLCRVGGNRERYTRVSVSTASRAAEKVPTGPSTVAAVAAAPAGCRRSERQILLQLSSARVAAASRRARQQRAAGARGDASGTRRDSGRRPRAMCLFDFCQERAKLTRTDPHKAIVAI